MRVGSILQMPQSDWFRERIEFSDLAHGQGIQWGGLQLKYEKNKYVILLALEYYLLNFWDFKIFFKILHYF